MTVTEISVRLGVCAETVRRWIRSGELKVSTRYDEKNTAARDYGITASDLAAFLETHPKYDVFGTRAIDDIDITISSMEQRLRIVEDVACGLKQQQDFLETEIKAMKATLSALRKERENGKHT